MRRMRGSFSRVFVALRGVHCVCCFMAVKRGPLSRPLTGRFSDDGPKKNADTARYDCEGKPNGQDAVSLEPYTRL